MWRHTTRGGSQWVGLGGTTTYRILYSLSNLSTDSGGGGVSSSKMRRAEWWGCKAGVSRFSVTNGTKLFLIYWSIVLIVTSKSVRTSYIPLLRKCDRGREASFCYAWIDKLDREEGARQGASKHCCNGRLVVQSNRIHPRGAFTCHYPLWCWDIVQTSLSFSW